MKLKTIIPNNEKEILVQINRLKDELFKHALCIGNSAYQLTEIEFYIKSTEQDESSNKVFFEPYTYAHPLQLTTGKLYAHASGIDITFGNEQLHLGVLIRGIAKFKDKNSPKTDFKLLENYNLEKIISGPHKVATELIGNLSFDKSNDLYFSELIYGTGGPYPFVHIAETARYGLSKKDDHFYNMKLRFIGFYPLQVVKNINNNKNIALANREQIVIEEVKRNRIQDLNTVKTILGYIPSAIK